MAQESARRPRVLVGACGSVAVVKVPEIVSRLVKEHDADVRVVWTGNACRFDEAAANYNAETKASLKDLISSGKIQSLVDDDEWNYKHVGKDPVVHIELRKWADVFLIAPLSANSLAKISHGLCDNLLTSVARAWDYSKPMLVAPAMNTFMWDHPLTSEQLGKLRSFGAGVVSPVSKTLACGDTGSGALAPVDQILAAVKESL
ncbi:Coenzyme A biosynthesis bifunctional protein coaBC, putative [Hondaea fermentalgiana]|uniref:Coenzyme A biosynthesis bifunctional protein coaBC, putative n=1 Tax=Hondaea fermentalgiana TaxID=2315210 RepID=A0A2R5GA44_9STRA|nr:Coenzyme A biosynthesis bifunctional protein coaBC, putative [Hondaea fermentalgiana]|eukprot:GBG26598.1 Coenzyme A biosynthesis bifunctional protein coaBC, putative [Hondaea fermentalgiana]